MRAKRKKNVLAAPVALVGSLGRKDSRRRRRRPNKAVAELLGQAARLPELGRATPGRASKALSRHLPSRRKRRKLVKKLKGDLGRLSGLAEGVSTVLSFAAAGGELLSALRGRDDDRQRPKASAETGDEEDWEEEDDAEGGDLEDSETAEEGDEAEEGSDTEDEGSDESRAESETDEESSDEEGMRRAS